MPDQKSLRISGSASIQAATKDGEKLRRFEMTAYTGGQMAQYWSDAPIVVDLAGMQVTEKSRPILLEHNARDIVGHTETIDNTGSELIVSGPISGGGQVAESVVSAADNGFPWQASIGADVLSEEFVQAGVDVTVNGRDFTGPLYIARKTQLSEVSFVALGADDATTARMVASLNSQKDSVMPDKQTDAKTDENKVEAKAPDQKVEAPSNPSVEASVNDAVSQIRAAAAAEATRVAGIEAVEGITGDIKAKAIAEGWDADKAELTVLRAARSEAPAGHVHSPAAVTGEVIEAAAVAASGLVSRPQLEEQYNEKTLEAAHKTFGRGFGLQDIFITAARANGYSGSGVKSDLRGVIQAAASGFSTIDIGGILSNTANKFLLMGFMGVERGWERITRIARANDFKTMTRYRLTGDAKYEKVAPGGEIAHGTLGEQSFTNKVDTYAKLFGIDRQDIINDDLGALTDIPQRLGRGAALRLNDLFWTEYLADHATFFPTDKSNGNYIDGAASALSAAGLALGQTAFRRQLDPDGNPLGLEPRILVVPPELETTARELMRSTNVDNSSGTRQPTANIWQGRYEVVVSSYLSNSAQWYLLADPRDLAMIETAFLFGNQTPTIESADVDFNLLGVQMRGYHDFGVNKQEFRAAVKSAGS